MGRSIPTGNAARHAVSSCCAAPSLRYGPEGDTPRRAACLFTMAESGLPAIADRRAIRESSFGLEELEQILRAIA